jgi:hypothetical protein
MHSQVLQIGSKLTKPGKFSSDVPLHRVYGDVPSDLDGGGRTCGVMHIRRSVLHIAGGVEILRVVHGDAESVGIGAVH